MKRSKFSEEQIAYALRLGDEFQQFGAGHFGPYKIRLARFIHAMHGKDVLCQTDAKGYDCHDFPFRVS